MPTLAVQQNKASTLGTKQTQHIHMNPVATQYTVIAENASK